jgi:hypothetical protein
MEAAKPKPKPKPNTTSITNKMAHENDAHDPEYVHRTNVHSILNNHGLIMGRPGNQGRYTYSRHITSVDIWDTVFDALTLPPSAHDTSGFIYDLSFGREQADLRPNAFPEVVLIPLPCATPGWRRCILHIEEVENVGNGHPRQEQPTGRYIPVPVSYHENHPIAGAIQRMFQLQAPVAPFYQSNEQLAILTSPSYNDEWVIQTASLLAQPGNNFEAFAQIIPAVIWGPGTNVFPDPALVRQANRTIVVPEYDMDPRGAQDAYEQWRAMVYPAAATQEERREAYSTYAADQINTHRRARIQFGYDFPQYPNPYVLPDNHGGGNGGEHQHENNPADRIRAQRHPANAYIQELYDAQNNDERARIAAVNIFEIVPPVLPALPALPAINIIEVD